MLFFNAQSSFTPSTLTCNENFETRTRKLHAVRASFTPISTAAGQQTASIYYLTGLGPVQASTDRPESTAAVKSEQHPGLAQTRCRSTARPRPRPSGSCAMSQQSDCARHASKLWAVPVLASGDAIRSRTLDSTISGCSAFLHTQRQPAPFSKSSCRLHNAFNSNGALFTPDDRLKVAVQRSQGLLAACCSA